MIKARLCTKEQYDSGKEELIARMAIHYERRDDTVEPGTKTSKSINEWDEYDVVDAENTPQRKVERELNQYLAFNASPYLPTMKPSKVLGGIDSEGQPQKPVYAIGKVLAPGKNLPSKKNHASYIDGSGHYDLTSYSYLEDHKTKFPAVYNVGIGQIAPHITTEVDCESLFSQAGFLADPRRSRIGGRHYERVVMTKHRLGQIYCHVPDVQELYLNRWHEKNWDENDERDANVFLELEKEIPLSSLHL